MSKNKTPPQGFPLLSFAQGLKLSRLYRQFSYQTHKRAGLQRTVRDFAGALDLAVADFATPAETTKWQVAQGLLAFNYFSEHEFATSYLTPLEELNAYSGYTFIEVEDLYEGALTDQEQAEIIVQDHYQKIQVAVSGRMNRQLDSELELQAHYNLGCQALYGELKPLELFHDLSSEQREECLETGFALEKDCLLEQVQPFMRKQHGKTAQSVSQTQFYPYFIQGMNNIAQQGALLSWPFYQKRYQNIKQAISSKLQAAQSRAFTKAQIYSNGELYQQVRDAYLANASKLDNEQLDKSLLDSSKHSSKLDNSKLESNLNNKLESYKFDKSSLRSQRNKQPTLTLAQRAAIQQEYVAQERALASTRHEQNLRPTVATYTQEREQDLATQSKKAKTTWQALHQFTDIAYEDLAPQYQDIDLYAAQVQVSFTNHQALRNFIMAYAQHTPYRNLNFIDVSKLTCLDGVFAYLPYTFDISAWDVSQVTSMKGTFAFSWFNGELNTWDVSKVTDMSYLFYAGLFNQPLNNWQVAQVESLAYTFAYSLFNQPLDTWQVTQVKDLRSTFASAYFNHSVDHWCLPHIEHYDCDTFRTSDECSIYPSEIWDKLSQYQQQLAQGVSLGSLKPTPITAKPDFMTLADEQARQAALAKYMAKLPLNPRYDQKTFGELYQKDLSQTGISLKFTDYLSLGMFVRDYCKTLQNWQADLNFIDVSELNNLSYVFTRTPFNGDISQWQTGKVKQAQMLFFGSSFNGDISQWDVRQLTNLKAAFAKSRFTRDLSSWQTSSLENLDYAFAFTNFNGDVSAWDVSRVNSAISTFMGSTFNQDLSAWVTSSLEQAEKMFAYSNFNQYLGTWDTTKLVNANLMFAFSAYNQNLSNWRLPKLERAMGMFAMSEFNQDLSAWRLPALVNANYFLAFTPNFKQDLNGIWLPKLQMAHHWLIGTSYNYNLTWFVNLLPAMVSQYPSELYSTQEYTSLPVGTELVDVQFSQLSKELVQALIATYKLSAEAKSKAHKLSAEPNGNELVAVGGKLRFSNAWSLRRFLEALLALEPRMDLSFISIEGLANLSYIFAKIPHVAVKLSNWDLSRVQDLTGAFLDVQSLTGVSHWQFPQLRFASGAFYNCKVQDDPSNWHFPPLENYVGMFMHTNLHKEQVKQFNIAADWQNYYALNDVDETLLAAELDVRYRAGIRLLSRRSHDTLNLVNENPSSEEIRELHQYFKTQVAEEMQSQRYMWVEQE
ncbi:BspA family leucine-rich repeat surface protein [Psittacicella hinzii]|uniref:BspA family leucine-rich repeat surface protein n=1 Tax=Psittacicella hinzii TaxID=2028575 RepID=A0A3A1YLZ1_9GAMM|nr:BspA family leucine-rich repeat surface protein [Psittacicella hinzii]RIY39182.1 hypothetical protein CKF58_02620 [Psittacicella hinzii]